MKAQSRGVSKRAARGRRSHTSSKGPTHQYGFEAELVRDLIANLPNVFNTVESLASEFDYARGRTDVVLVIDGTVVAIEGKLTRWRDALHQAYRNRCFAHRSFIALPSGTARLAMRFEGQFRDREVGLLAVTPDGVETLIEADTSVPVEPWLTARAVAAALPC